MAEERMYIIPLGDAYEYVRTRRAKRAVAIIRVFLARHMKAKDEEVRVSEGINTALWARGIQKPPRKIKVRVIKENGLVKAYLPDEKIKKPEAKKEEGKEEKAAEKTAEPKPANEVKQPAAKNAEAPKPAKPKAEEPKK